MKIKINDNSHLNLKLEIREELVQRILHEQPQKSIIRVLDCFAGKGILWQTIQEHFKHKKSPVAFQIIAIEKRKNLNRPIYLAGDNLKFLQSFNLDEFDIIDLDVYGLPIEQLDYVLQHSTKPYYCATIILISYSRISHRLLNINHIPLKMYNKIPTLFICKFKHFLYNFLLKHGVKTLYGYFSETPLKMYFYFKKQK